MTSRERINATLNHKEPDRVPLDLGGSTVTGMHATTVYALRQAMGLDRPGTPVKVIDPFQMLSEIKPDLMDALGVDVVALTGPRTLFGYKKEGWKPWTFFDGTPLLVPEGFNTQPEPNGDILMYPQGDRSVPASGRMPKGGFYFDAIVRQPPIDDTRLNVEDNLEEFGPISEDDLQFLRQEAERLYNEGGRAIVVGLGGTSFGDIALVPGLALKHPKGIRDINGTSVRFRAETTSPGFSSANARSPSTTWRGCNRSSGTRQPSSALRGLISACRLDRSFLPQHTGTFICRFISK